MEDDDSERLRVDLCEYLARELHDTVAGQLQGMLVEMELLGRRREAPEEIETFKAATRQALGSLRGLLYQLRQRPEPTETIQEQIERRVGAALEAPRVRRRRSTPAQL